MDNNKNKNHKGFKIFVLLLLVGVLFFINKNNQLKFIQAYKSLTTREKSLKKIKSIDINESDFKIEWLNRNIAKWSGTKLSIMDIEDNLILEKQFDFDNPDAVFRKDRIYIMDKSSGDIYILDNEGQTIERVELEKSINNFKEDENEIIVHTKSEVEENLVFLNTKGVFLRIHPIEDMNILTYDADKNYERYLISNLIIEDALKSEIYIFSINGELIDTVHITNEITVFTKFVNDDLIALTDKCLYYIKDSKIFWKRTFSDIKDILLNDNGIYILYGDNLELIDLEGRTIEKFELTKYYNNLKDFGRNIFLIGYNNLIGIQGNKIIIEYNHDTGIKDIVVNRNYLGIIDDSNLHLFEVNNK